MNVDFTRSDLNTAITDALAKVSDPVWTRAIYRAAVHMSAGQFLFDGRCVMLRSASTERVYRINVAEPMDCACSAHAHGRICWHVVGARLVVRAAELHARQHRFVQAQRAADALFS